MESGQARVELVKVKYGLTYGHNYTVFRMPLLLLEQSETTAAMLVIVFRLYFPLINSTGLIMFVKDTIWSLFFPKSPENALIYPQKSQQSTFK